MEVIVTGSRSSSEDWHRAQQWPLQDLPRLSAEQKAVAQKMGISEEAYARSAYAGELSRAELQNKAERFGHLIQAKMREMLPNASVQTVTLKTFAGRIQVLAVAGDRRIPLEVDEDLVDSLLRTGSPELDAQLKRIVELGIPATGSAKAS